VAVWSEGPAEGKYRNVTRRFRFLAASTQRCIDLMALATPPHFRNPAPLAKMVSTLRDVCCHEAAPGWASEWATTPTKRRVWTSYPSQPPNAVLRDAGGQQNLLANVELESTAMTAPT